MELPPLDQLTAAAARALVVVLLSSLAAAPVLAAWRTGDPSRRRLLMVLLAAPLIAPWLVSVYGLLFWRPDVARYPWALEGLLVLAWTCRVLPVVVLLRALAPRDPWSDRARYLAGMHGVPRPLGPRLRAALMGGPGLGAALAFVWVFSGFAAESLLKRPGWSPWLFERLALHVPAGSLLLGVLAVLAPMIVLAVLWIRLPRPHPGPWADDGSQTRGPLAVVGLPIAIAAAALVPGVSLVGLLIQGLGALQGAFARAGAIPELSATALIGTGAALLGWWLAALVLPAALALAGPVVIALVVQAASVWWGTPGTDSPIPLILALAWLSTPLALLARIAIRRGEPARAMAIAGMLPGPARARLQHHLLGWKVTATVLVLAAWNAFEVAATATLAPLGKPPISVFLFNQMHYGATAPLAATVLLAMVVVAAMAGLVWWGDARLRGLSRRAAP